MIRFPLTPSPGPPRTASVEIIERGELPQDKEHTGRCNYCRTKFRFKASEATGTWSDPREGSGLKVNCPLCGRECFV